MRKTHLITFAARQIHNSKLKIRFNRSGFFIFVSCLSDKRRGMIMTVKRDKSLDLSIRLLYNYYMGLKIRLHIKEKHDG